MAEIEQTIQGVSYTEDNIKTLEWHEHIRRRPGMYIGKLGDGQYQDDGIYVLIKEIIDNSIDEFMMGNGKQIEVTIENETVTIRDYGRGIPLGKVVDVVSKMNTGGKYDSESFQKSIGLNGVGSKAVNALSSSFIVESIRDKKIKRAEFSKGILIKEHDIQESSEKNGTRITYVVDNTIFENYSYHLDFVVQMLKNYTYLNKGLKMILNGTTYVSKEGIVDLLRDNIREEQLYPIIHLETKDLEIAMTHTSAYSEDYYTFVNGQHTTQGGTHLAAFKEALAKTVREFYKKEYDVNDIRMGIVAVISIRVQEPVFESQTKTKLGSKDMSPNNGISIRSYTMDFIGEQFDNYLHRNPDTAKSLQEKIISSENDRKSISKIQKEAKEKAKKANLNNKKLRDCRCHLTDQRRVKEGEFDPREESSIFITEGNSASGSITKARDANNQAVFSLRGKPLNTFGLKRDIVYKNEEFFLLQAALNIEDGMDNLRYNKVIIATDADVDGMHIRLLMITFFLQFFPDVIKEGHLFILQTPLFRVRNKKKTQYCYSEEEREKAIKALGPKPEITRFKGLGEIDWQEFKEFIGENMRLDQVTMHSADKIKELLTFYMGKNTPTRQQFIIENLVVEEDLVENQSAI
ncbi:MAG: type IIA DNA topoisomerase subunit B [Marinilabiliaceae bacterium]|nr:type IIA DNA topoisomerase subunit B [Marinilabiliaceae bacterium]